MAQSQAKRVYLERDLDVQMPATQENPGGSVRRLRAGWNDLDEQMASHAVLSRLVPQDPAAQARADKRREAELARDKAIGEAHTAYHQAMAEVAEEEAKAQQQAAEEYGQRQANAIERGVAFNEPHPDPETAMAAARTAQPAHVFPAAAFLQKPLGEEEEGKVQNLPSEADVTRRQTESRERLAGEPGKTSGAAGAGADAKDEKTRTKG